jgi:phenylacetate-CoA ligase
LNRWTQAIYFAVPVWAQNLLTNAYGLHLRYLRYGREQRTVLAELLAAERYADATVRERQMDALRRTIRHAYGTVPLYASRGRDPSGDIQSAEDLLGLPIVSKDDLRQRKSDVISSRFLGAKLNVIHTGGTTGKPLSVYCDRSTLQRNYAFYGRLLAWAGIKSSDRVAVLAGRTIVPPSQVKPPFWRSNRPGRSLLFSSYHISKHTVPYYLKALSDFRPALIDSYPSAVSVLARYILDEGITTVRPRAVITSSETLSDETRALVERAFGCRVYDHYGAAEMAAFISQCEHSRYHVNADFGIVEVVRDGRPAMAGEVGEIIATGFINPVMPLVRYATGDLAIQDGVPCPCGRPFPTIQRILGRMDDVVTTPDGRQIGRLDPIFKAAATMVESRIVQDAPDHVRLEIVTTGELPANERDDLLRELAARLGPSMRIEIKNVASIPRAGSGKLRTVVNEIRRSL